MDGTEVEVVDVREVGSRVVGITLEAPPGFDALPGQFVQVRATVEGEAVTRHYSVSSPAVDDTFEVTVGVDPDGTLSPYLAAASPGDGVEVDGPYGRVYYEGEDRVAVLASGPGVGAAVGVAERAVLDGGEAAVVYRSAQPVHEDRLAGLAAAGTPVYVVSGERTFRSAVGDVVDGRQTFVYGFEPFVESAVAALEAAGGDPAAAKMENFG